MINYLKQKFWSPYAAGAGIGILTILTVSLTGHYLGASSVFEHIAYFVSSFFFYGQTLPLIDWKTTFVISIFFGALASSKLSGIQEKGLPSIWTNTFGNSTQKRYIAAFVGGMLVLFGARIAGGCTSGHAVCGGMKLALTSWVFLLTLFVSSMITAFIIYKK